MQYRGLIATDSLGMGALDQRYGVTTASLMALNAGNDLLMYGNDPGHDPLEAKNVYDSILLKVKESEIPEIRIDESVKRILEAKAKFGILKEVFTSTEGVENLVGTAHNLADAQEIARKTITLIKNDNKLLPLNYGVSVALVSPKGIFTTNTFQKHYTSDIIEIPTSLDPSPEEVTNILSNLASTGRDVVILGTFDARTNRGQVRLLEMLQDYAVVVIAFGLPYDLTILPSTPTFLATYGHSSPSLAVLPEILFGDTYPTGRLPVSISDEYPVGFGISY
jgi:beta-N-acetylhexosaminidase